MRLEAAQYRELAAFAQFGSDLDEDTRGKLERGKRLMEILKQDQYNPMDVAEQVSVYFSLIKGYMDNVPVDKISEFEAGLREYLVDTADKVLDKIRKTGQLGEEIEKELEKAINDYKDTLDYLQAEKSVE